MPSPVKNKTYPACLSVMDAERAISPPATAIDSCINTNLPVVGNYLQINYSQLIMYLFAY
jgi:hypothetical protein